MVLGKQFESPSGLDLVLMTSSRISILAADSTLRATATAFRTGRKSVWRNKLAGLSFILTILIRFLKNGTGQNISHQGMKLSNTLNF